MTKATSFKTRFTVTARPVVECTLEERRTKSEFHDECDINKIMARYRRTGVLPEYAHQAAAQYGDFSQIPSFAEMQHKIIAANELFGALPAIVRKQFDNDPGQFLEASQTAEGRSLLVKLGLGAPNPLDDSPAPSKASQKAPKEPFSEGVQPSEPNKTVEN